MPLKGSLKVVLEGRGTATVRETDHVATGGGGTVYRLGDTAVKLAHDPRDLDLNVLKIMANLSHPHILFPKLVLDERGNTPIGVWMKFSNGEPLSRVFTNDWRNLAGFEDKHAHTLVDRIFRVTDFAHAHDFWEIDFNELGMSVNFDPKRGDDTAPDVYDVDPWVYKGRVPPTVKVMDSIHDPHNPLGREADIYATAINAWQVYTGIHPYKGGLDGFKPNQIKDRMRQNKSVFTPGIRLNTAVRTGSNSNFDQIPPKLLAWFEAVFQHGDRSVPPSPFDKGGAARTAIAQRIIVTAAGALIFDKLFSNAIDPVIRIYHCGVVLLRSGKLIDLNTKRQIAVVKSHDAKVVDTGNGWLIADKGTGFEFTYVDRNSLQAQQLTLMLKGYQVITYENRMFMVTDQGLTELKLFSMAKAILSADKSWSAMVNSTRWYDGVGVMDAMGAMFLIAPFSTNAVAQVRVRELDGLRVVNAKAGNRFIAIIAVDKNGDYVKIELTLDRDYKSYTVWTGNSDTADLNMALLPKGVGATIVDDGELVIFVPASNTVRKVPDRDIVTTMTLGNREDKVVYIKDGTAWSVRMK